MSGATNRTAYTIGGDGARFDELLPGGLPGEGTGLDVYSTFGGGVSYDDSGTLSHRYGIEDPEIPDAMAACNARVWQKARARLETDRDPAKGKSKARKRPTLSGYDSFTNSSGGRPVEDSDDPSAYIPPQAIGVLGVLRPDLPAEILQEAF